MSFFRNMEKAQAYRRALEDFNKEALFEAFLLQQEFSNAESSISIYFYNVTKDKISRNHKHFTIQDRFELIDAIHTNILRQNPDILGTPKL